MQTAVINLIPALKVFFIPLGCAWGHEESSDVKIVHVNWQVS